MKILLKYYSQTGNTEKLCKGVYERIVNKYNKNDIDITDDDVDDYEKYDIIILGFWVKEGAPNLEAIHEIECVKNKKIILLGTLGSDPGSKHANNVRTECEKLVDKSNEFMGFFLSRGKVDDKLLNTIKLLPMSDQIVNAMYEASMTSREPNNNDIQKAADYIFERIDSNARNYH